MLIGGLGFYQASNDIRREFQEYATEMDAAINILEARREDFTLDASEVVDMQDLRRESEAQGVSIDWDSIENNWQDVEERQVRLRAGFHFLFYSIFPLVAARIRRNTHLHKTRHPAKRRR